jgi:hypothetical protein
VSARRRWFDWKKATGFPCEAQAMPKIQCIYCDTVYDPGRTGGSCTDCGREHPPGSLVRPPDVFKVPVPTATGRVRPVTEEEERARRQASSALFTVAALNLLCNGLLVALIFLVLQQGQPGPNVAGAIAVGIFLGFTGLFVLLGLWARYEPLAPSVLGLMLYTGVALLQCVLSPGLACQELVINGIIIFGLIQAVQAALQARRNRPTEAV